jgi:hypothetical protein
MLSSSLLSFFIPDSLLFCSNVLVILPKIDKSLYIVRKAKHLLTQKALKTLYYSLIYNRLIYCIQIWSSASPSMINVLQKSKNGNMLNKQRSLQFPY